MSSYRSGKEISRSLWNLKFYFVLQRQLFSLPRSRRSSTPTHISFIYNTFNIILLHTPMYRKRYLPFGFSSQISVFIYRRLPRYYLPRPTHETFVVYYPHIRRKSILRIVRVLFAQSSCLLYYFVSSLNTEKFWGRKFLVCTIITLSLLNIACYR